MRSVYWFLSLSHTHTHTHTNTQVQWLLFSQHHSLLGLSGVSRSRPFLSGLYMPWCCQALDTGWVGSVVGSGRYLVTSRTDQPSRQLQLGTILLDFVCVFYVLLHPPCILTVHCFVGLIITEQTYTRHNTVNAVQRNSELIWCVAF